MKYQLENKIAVISGGDSGIGLAVSKRLKANNVKIYNISKVGENLDLFEKSYACDIADDQKVAAVVADILNSAGKIDLLFCNAGFGIAGKVENASIESIDKIMNVNLIAHIKMTRLFLKDINEGGRIVFTGSLASIIPLPYQACYSASKAGIESFSRALNSELKSRKISVTTIMPGDINTNFTAERVKETDESKDEDRGIRKMEKAEKNGKNPDFVAKRVLKIVTKKKPPLRSSIGGSSKFLAGLVKIVPIRLLNFLVKNIYT